MHIKRSEVWENAGRKAKLRNMCQLLNNALPVIMSNHLSAQLFTIAEFVRAYFETPKRGIIEESN